MRFLYSKLIIFILVSLCNLLVSQPLHATTSYSDPPSCSGISMWPELKYGVYDTAVAQLQKILNLSVDTKVANSGVGSAGNETNYFGTLTHEAVIKFQNKYENEILRPISLRRGTGNVGPLTRLKTELVCFETVAAKRLSAGENNATGKSRIVQRNVTQVPATVPALAKASTSSTRQTMKWGAYAGYSASELAAFERLVGTPVDMKAVFTNWKDDFPFDAAAGLVASHKTLVIYWEQYGVSLDSIIAGESDEYIKEFSRQARSYGGLVLLAPFHEMNGNWDPWGGLVGTNSPDKVIAAWRHVHTIFGKQPNVSFVWTVNNISVPDTRANAIKNYYPGDEYVEYVGIDGFNFGDPWQTFDSLFSAPLSEVSAYNKPVYILSMGAAPGADKASWITDALGKQVYLYPQLQGWIWFNENKEKDWRINSDARSLAAFKKILP